MDEDTRLLALSAIAHRSRLAIFRLLAAAGPRGLPARQISAQLGIVPSSLSFHLKDLSRAKLVSGNREGTFICYSAGLDAIRGAIDLLTEAALLTPQGSLLPGKEDTKISDTDAWLLAPLPVRPMAALPVEAAGEPVSDQ